MKRSSCSVQAYFANVVAAIHFELKNAKCISKTCTLLRYLNLVYDSHNSTLLHFALDGLMKIEKKASTAGIPMKFSLSLNVCTWKMRSNREKNVSFSYLQFFVVFVGFSFTTSHIIIKMLKPIWKGMDMRERARTSQTFQNCESSRWNLNAQGKHALCEEKYRNH